MRKRIGGAEVIQARKWVTERREPLVRGRGNWSANARCAWRTQKHRSRFAGATKEGCATSNRRFRSNLPYLGNPCGEKSASSRRRRSRHARKNRFQPLNDRGAFNTRRQGLLDRERRPPP